MEKLGIDILHVSAGISDNTVPQVPEGLPYNWIVYGGTEIKKQVNIPVIVVNCIRTPEQAEYIINNNLADLVAIGRGHLADPAWVNHVKNGEKIVACIHCKKCGWFTKAETCPKKG